LLAAPTSLAMVVQPADSAVDGSPFTRQPVVRVLDQNGDSIAAAGLSVTAEILSGGGTLDGTATVTTDASGVATFTDLGISGAAGSRTLRFTSGSLNPVTSAAVYVAGAAAVGSKLALTTQPAATAQSGVALTRQPVVQIQDAGGSPAATAGVTVTASLDGGGTLGGTTSAVTDGTGTATFTDLVITGTAGPRTLTFSATSLTAAVSDTIQLSVPTPASTSAQIAAVRAATDGAIDLPIEQALVTYTKPLIGADAAGFFVQSERAGPAFYVAVDPTTLGGGVAAGDKVSFTATLKQTLNGIVQVNTLSNFSIQSHGNDVASLVVPVDTVVNLPAQIGTYESRYVSITGTLAAAPASAGTGFVSAQINTTGTSGNTNLRFRTTTALSTQYDLALGCTISATAPMWRFTAQAQPSAWANADLTSVVCPAPKVTSVTVNNATSVTVNFDRLIDPASVNANGSQFTVDNGLTVSAASVSGKTVVLTTSSQAGGTTYTVTVAGSVQDTRGTGVAAANNSGTFTGYSAAAVLQITEVMPNIASNHDLVELVATQGGFVGGMKLYQDSITVLATLPNVTVNAGDIIVIHLVPLGTTGIAPASESSAKNEYATGTYSANYDGAWDFLGGTSGITLSSRTIRILSSTGTIQDAVAATTNSSPPASFGPSIRQIQAVGQWLPADCSGSTCDQNTGMAISANWNGTSTSPATGSSLRRIWGTDTQKKEDWAVVAASMGAINP